MAKFDFVIGNPPYQENYNGDSNGANPVYHLFLDESRKVASKGSLIHPARFLFNVGKTPKPWNKKMLEDPHFKISSYWNNSGDVFPNGVDIKGGIVISYWDQNKNFGPIGTFIVFDELRSILQKVNKKGESSFSEIVSPVGVYRLTDQLYEENTWAITRPSRGHKYDVTSNVFDVFPELFFDECPKNGCDYIRIYGRLKNRRITKWIKAEYVKVPESFANYKLFIPKANGSGAFGEPLSNPEVGEPNVGHTFTFLSIGGFKTKEEALNAQKYLKTKFARAMLGTLKATQDNLQGTWKNVPLQNFASNNEIDWSKSITEVDQQLYRKYNLSPQEIEFIETNVKEME